MKMLSVSIAGLGVLALLLGIVEKLLGIQTIMGVTAGGFIRGATALYALTVVVMLYDRWYACTDKTAPPPKP